MRSQAVACALICGRDRSARSRSWPPARPRRHAGRRSLGKGELGGAGARPVGFVCDGDPGRDDGLVTLIFARDHEVAVGRDLALHDLAALFYQLRLAVLVLVAEPAHVHGLSSTEVRVGAGAAWLVAV